MKNGEMGEAEVGRDVLLKEKEAQRRLLQLLPTKAQLGFSSLKEHFSQRGDTGVRRFLQSSKPHDAIKLEYTCIDVTDEFIALGCNFGILFFFDRKLGRLQRFVSETKQVPIVCVKILTSQNFVVTGQFNGALTIFNYGREKDGNYKVLLKCTVDDHHHSPVTCVEWTPDGTKLFSGDSEGNVAISVINMDDGQTHTVFICKENSPITQLSLCQAALVVSTLRRSLIWPFSLKTPVQVGQQERKLYGNFGACFYSRLHDQASNSLPNVYAARPGLRIWRANMEGKVSTTMIFKDSIAKGEPEISTLNLSSSSSKNGLQTEPKQFGPLIVFADTYLVSWQGPCIWVLDPTLGVVAGCHSNFGCIVDVATYNREMFVLTKGDENFIRRITFENRAQSPIIEVKTLNWNEEEETEFKIPRAGSVNQFEENDKIDKIIGGVMSTTVGFISGVKRNVVKTIEQIKTRDESEESTASSGDSPISMNPSSPITIVRRKDVNGGTPKTGSDEESRSLIASPCVIISSPKLEVRSNEKLDDDDTDETPTVNDELSENQAPNCQEWPASQNMNSDRIGDSETTKMEIVVKHDLREKTIPFHHISEKDFTSDIVFEGTSKRKPKKRRKFNKGQKKLEYGDSSEDEKKLPNVMDKAAGSTDSIENEAADLVRDAKRELDTESIDIETIAKEENHPNERETNDVQISAISNVSDAQIVGSGMETEKKEEDSLDKGDLNEIEIVNEDNRYHTNSSRTIQIEKREDEAPLNNSISEMEGIPSVVTTVSEYLDNGTGSITSETSDGVRSNKEDNKRHSCDDEIGVDGSQVPDDQIVSQVDIRKVPETVATNIDSISTIAFKVARTEENDSQNYENFDVNAVDVNARKDSTNLGQTNTAEMEGQDGALFDPSEVLNVEIAAQEPIKCSHPSEPCKQVHGEAVERTHVRGSSNGCIYVGQDDTINSNVCWLDEDDEKIGLDDSPPRSPMNNEPSLFPAPQMNYHSIYSQDTLSLSEISFSEPEHDIPAYTNETRDRDDDLIDSLAMLSIGSDEMTDVEDNQCHSPPINLDQDGGVELTEASFLQHRFGVGSAKDSIRGSNCSSPSVFEIDAPLPLSPHSMAEKVSERLRLLADSWADIPVPNCGSIQSITVTDTLIWCVDNHEHLFVSAASSAVVTWKKIDGRARQIAANQSGSIIWGVNRKKIASYRANVKASNPQGSDWETVESEVLEVAVDDNSVWGIRTNGDIFVRTGVSEQKPEGTGQRSIRTASDLVHITCLGSMVWGLDIYSHVQIYQGNLSCLGGNEQSVQWLELPGITASYVTLGPKGVCWIIDKDGKIWFNSEISDHNLFGGKWFQLSIGEYLVQDPTVMSTVVSFFKRGNEPKVLSGNNISGIWILSKHGTLHAARGHLLGTRWELTVPIAMASSTFWTCVSAQGATGNGGFVWALQPNGDLHCFRPESKSFVVQPPPRTILKFISASPRSLWALTNNQDVYIRRGISETAPQGLKWIIVDMSSMGSERICSIACGILVVWAVDFHGNVWFQMGKEDTRKTVFSPAWIQVEGSPFDGCRFTKVAVGSNDCTVWAVDDRNNVYARKDVTESFLIGTAWDVVAGTGAKDISISDNLVWALCPAGNIVCRFGISAINFVGDYWKTVPGCFEHISVSADDELWGIDRQGQLYKRHTVHFFGAQSTRKVPSYSQLFPTDDDWELI